MTENKKKRTPQEVKLAIQIKKKLGYGIEPKTCANCKLSTKEVPELFEGFPLGCNKFQELVVFGVEVEGSCTAWKRKPQKRPAKEDGEGAKSEGSPKPPVAKKKSGGGKKK